MEQDLADRFARVEEFGVTNVGAERIASELLDLQEQGVAVSDDELRDNDLSDTEIGLIRRMVHTMEECGQLTLAFDQLHGF